MTTSAVNSFSALGFTPEEAVVDALRADLADIVRGYIERSQMQQIPLAKKLGIPQSTVSAIKNDNIDKLSVEYFIRILTRAKIPWSAKCWNPPHDAAWVAGGLSQLISQTMVQQSKPAVEPPNFLRRGAPVALTNFTLGSAASAIDTAITQSDGNA